MINFFEKNNNLDYEKIESEIKKNIENRGKKSKEYNNIIGEIVINNEVNEETKNSLSSLNIYCDIKIPRIISSHRKIVGPGLVKVRKFFDDEIRLSVDPVIDKQIEFNKKIIEQINSKFDEINKRFDETSKHIDENIKQTNSNIKEIFRLRKNIEDGD